VATGTARPQSAGAAPEPTLTVHAPILALAKAPAARPAGRSAEMPGKLAPSGTMPQKALQASLDGNAPTARGKPLKEARRPARNAARTAPAAQSLPATSRGAMAVAGAPQGDWETF
jgi:hypothetical protein